MHPSQKYHPGFGPRCDARGGANLTNIARLAALKARLALAECYALLMRHSPAPAWIGDFFLGVETLAQHILWPLGLLHRTEDRPERPFPVFDGRLGAALAKAFGHRGIIARIHAAESWIAIGEGARAASIALQAMAHEPTPAVRDVLVRALLASEHASPGEIFAASREPSAKAAATPRMKCRGAPLRVGFLCDFFHNAISQQTLAPQFALHDRRRFVPVLYDSGQFPCQRIYPGVEYHRVAALDDAALADRIRADHIDVLIEMNGRLRRANRLGVVRQRAAPVQASWYNCPATSGVAEMDYVIAGAVALGPQQERWLVERLAPLSRGACGGWRLPASPAASPAPVTTSGIFTFGNFADAFKVNPGVIDVWADILQRAPNARLLLKSAALDRPHARLLTWRAFARRGIRPGRLMLEGFSSYAIMRERYAAVDLMLDTFPFSSGSTAINALWQGVPVLTIAGGEWRGRLAASILASAGLGEFACEDAAEYAAKAIALANDPSPLTKLRSGMRERLLARSTYFRIADFTRDFEDAVIAMAAARADLAEHASRECGGGARP